MAQRRPLGEISANSRRQIELSPYLRGKIAGSASCGVSPAQISRDLGISDSIVRSTLKLDGQRINGNSLSRPGRPQNSTARSERYVLRLVRLRPKITYQEIRKELGLDWSDSTLYRILQRHGITNWRAKQRPDLTPELAKLRYEWAKEHMK
jgi:transposase